MTDRELIAMLVEALAELSNFIDMEYGEQEVDRNCPDTRKALAAAKEWSEKNV